MCGKYPDGNEAGEFDGDMALLASSLVCDAINY